MRVGILVQSAMRGARSERSLLAGICKGIEVIREESASGHAGAHPAEALLLLGVDSQDVPPLPGCVVLHRALPLSLLLLGHTLQKKHSPTALHKSSRIYSRRQLCYIALQSLPQTGPPIILSRVDP